MDPLVSINNNKMYCLSGLVYANKGIKKRQKQGETAKAESAKDDFGQGEDLTRDRITGVCLQPRRRDEKLGSGG